MTSKKLHRQWLKLLWQAKKSRRIIPLLQGEKQGTFGNFLKVSLGTVFSRTVAHFQNISAVKGCCSKTPTILGIEEPLSFSLLQVKKAKEISPKEFSNGLCYLQLINHLVPKCSSATCLKMHCILKQ